MSNLVQQLKEQKKLEQSHSKALKPSVAKANKLVAALLESILLDGMRHATILQALADMNAGEMSSSSNIDVAVADLHQEIREHVRVEAEILSKVGVIAREAKERHVKAVLQSILEDEKRYHSTLQALSNMMERGSMTVGDYLELLQKYMSVQK
jgi:hypothetical protein